jgi:Lrp/AsnC family leucine-responsive transcriptional regulator
MDEIDAIILRELLTDARASYTALGERASLSANAVAERVRRMRRDGTIQGFSVDVAPEALGHRLFALIDLRFAPGTSADVFEKNIAGRRGVLGFTLTTGRSDCTIRVAVSDQNQLVELIEELREFGATETYSRIILREKRYAHVI